MHVVDCVERIYDLHDAVGVFFGDRAGAFDAVPKPARWYVQMYRAGYKRYPSRGASIASTDAILRLAREHNLAPQDVDEIDVRARQRSMASSVTDSRSGKRRR